MALEPQAIEVIAKAAAREAISEVRREEWKRKRGQVLRNTQKLMENYNRIVQSVQEGVAELSDLTDEPIEGLDSDEALFVESILKSKTRSVVMLAHVDKCLGLLESEMEQLGTPEKYLAYKYFYLDGMQHESIGEVYGCTDRTSQRWIRELDNILSVYLFGVDAVITE